MIELKVKIVKLFGNQEDYNDKHTLEIEDLTRKLEVTMDDDTTAAFQLGLSTILK